MTEFILGNNGLLIRQVVPASDSDHNAGVARIYTKKVHLSLAEADELYHRLRGELPLLQQRRALHEREELEKREKDLEAQIQAVRNRLNRGTA